MSYWSSAQRNIVYVLIAMCTQAVADVESMFTSDPVDLCRFWLQVALAGLICHRAYIDKSPAEVLSTKTEPVAQPEGNK